MALEVIGIEGQVTAGGAARGPATTLNLRNGTAYVAAAQPAGTDTTFQAGDIVVYLHSVERRKQSVEGPATGNIHNTFNHNVQISINGGTAVNMVDIGYFRGGNSNRQASGAFAYTLPSGQTLQDIVVSHQISNQAGNNGNYGRSFRLLIVRGAEPDYDNTSDLGVVVSRSSLASFPDQDSIEWEQPSSTSWSTTNYNSGVGVIWFASWRKDSSGVDPTQDPDPDPQNPTFITRPTTSEFIGSSAGTGDGGFETNVSHAGGHAALTYFQMGFLNYAAINGVWNNGNTYGFVTDENDTNGGAGLGIFFREAATSTVRAVSGTASVGTFSTTGGVGSETLTKTLPASSASMLATTAAPPPSVITTVTVSGSATMSVSAAAPAPTATTPIKTLPASSTPVGTLTLSGAVGKETPVTGVPASQTSVGTLGATGSVSNETQVQPLPQGTASLALSASATVGKQTPVKPLSGNATLSMSATGVVGKETPVKPVSGAASFGTLGASASLDSISTVGISGSATLSLSTTGSVAKETITKTLPASTTSVGTLSVTGSVTVGGQGEVSGSASVGTLQASSSVGKETPVKGVSGTVSVGTLSASGSVQKQTIIQTLGAAQVSFSIATQGSVTQATPVKPVAGQAGISISVAGSISVESTGQVDGSISVGTISATGSIAVLAITSLEVTIDGVGDIVENLLTRSEIVAIEEIWNTGLTQLGVGRVDSATDDNSAQAALLRAVWPNFRKQFISDHAWNGCKTTAQLTALPDSDFKDTTRWSNIFSLPSDYIRALTVNGHRNQPDNSESVMWEIEVVANTSGTKSRCLCTNQSTAKLEYVFDVGDSVDLLAPAMKHAMGLAFGAFVAPNFGKSANEIALLEQKVKENLLKARGIDGQENSARYFSPSELVESRYRSL